MPVCLCELESPPVLFALIKQQRYGTLDTLNQSPPHYWNITLLQSQETQCLDHDHIMSKRCTFRFVPFLRAPLQVQQWHVTCMFTYSVVCGLTVPTQYTVKTELPKCHRSHRSMSCRRDVLNMLNAASMAASKKSGTKRGTRNTENWQNFD